MPTYIDLTNLSPATITALSSTAPTITQVQITTSGYVVKDDTAVSTSGGYIKITGTNFTAGTQVVIGSVTATSVTFVNSTTLNVQVPAQAAGTYIVYVTVSNGGVAILVNGLTYSGDPTWVTGSTLPGGTVNSAISIQFSATGDAPVTYALQAGSTLPPGLSLTSGGLLSGTVTGITSETTYNFTVEAIDGQAQESPRAFSITITASDANFEYVTTLLSANNPASTFVSDASTNNFAVTVFGDTRPNNFGPYTPGYYSNYFTSTNALTVPDNAAWDLNTDITIEAFCYLESYNTSDQYYIVSQVATGQRAWGFGLANGKLQIYYTTNGSTDAFVYSNSFTVVAGQWYHFAVTRTSAGVYTFYVNGVATGSTTDAATVFTSNQPLTIGQFGNFGISTLGWKGFISNLRFVRGSIVYSGNFTPSTTPLTAITNTALLTCQSNRFIDNSTNNFTVTVSGSMSVSGFDPFAPNSSYSSYGSGYCGATSDFLRISPAGTDSFGTGDFTVECWLNPLAATAVNLSQPSVTTNSWAILTYNGQLYWQENGGNLGGTGYGTVVQQAWNHLAVCRSGTTIRWFVNGVQVNSTTNSFNYSGAPATRNIGPANGGSAPAYISDFRIVKGTAVYTGAFTPPAAPLTAVTNTSLLTLQNNQPNNNSMFLDSSSNNFLITRNGNTTQGSFSPYGGGWSNYFDGSGDYLSLSYNAAISIVSGDFTVEMWIYRTAGSAEQYLWSNRSDNPGTGWEWRINSTNLMQFFFTAGSSLTSSSTIPVNTWTHLAVTRQTNTVRMFINGTQDATATFSNGTSTSASLFIGWSTSSGGLFQGYMSNARLVKGTAVYTSNFTPSTTPLTPIANTSLLTCADNRFVDDSANNFTITRNGDVSIQRFNPFNPVLTTPTSYSGYFDGTGDYLEIPANSAFDFGSGNFTIECWAYIAGNSTANSSGNREAILFSNDDDISGAVVNGSVCLLISGNASTTGTGILFYRRQTSGADAEEFLYTGSIAQNTWHNIAVTKSGSTVRIFLNGTQVLSQTATNTTFGTSSKVNTIADRRVTNFRNDLNGYISNLRIVKGTAVYTSNFTPSTTPLTAIANTSLLTLQNATFVDNSTNNFTITANGNSVPRQFNPFGWTNTTGSSAAYSVANYGGSMYFDGTGDYLNTTVPNSLGSGDFTIECWAYSTGSVTNNGVFHLHPTLFPSTTGGVAVAFGASGNGWYWYWGSTGQGTATGAGTPVANTWYHIAVTRSGSTTRLFINGVQAASASDSFTYTGTNLSIGGYYSTGYLLNGYISNFRIVRGQALYTSNFAPPVAPLSFNANAVLQVNGTSAAIYDSSMIATYETVGNSSSTGVIKKYGNSSIYFDGTGDYVFAPSSATTSLTGNFTIELWAYRAASGNYRAFTIGDSVGTSGIEIYVSGANWVVYSNSATRITGASATREVWTHLALVRSGSTVTLYVNGTASGSTWSSSATFSGAVYVGAEFFNGGVTSDTNGYIDDLRITNGVARYTANFTPPTTPFIQF